MLEFIILMVILDLLMKWKWTAPQEEPRQEEPKAPTAYVCDNSMAWDFKTLDDAMEFRELRLSGWKGNAIDFYKLKEEE